MPALRTKYNPFTEALWEPYVIALREHGCYSLAAEAVGCSSREIAEIRKATPGFQELCEDAIQMYRESFEHAAAKRARDGFDVPIVGGRNRDEIVAYEKKYSDNLMAMFLKRHDPSFKDKVQIEAEVVSKTREFDFGRYPKPIRDQLRKTLMMIKEWEESEEEKRRLGVPSDSVDDAEVAE